MIPPKQLELFSVKKAAELKMEEGSTLSQSCESEIRDGPVEYIQLKEEITFKDQIKKLEEEKRILVKAIKQLQQKQSVEKEIGAEISTSPTHKYYFNFGKINPEGGNAFWGTANKPFLLARILLAIFLDIHFHDAAKMNAKHTFTYGLFYREQPK